jgi:oligopeptide transport system substrate-binding protein
MQSYREANIYYRQYFPISAKISYMKFAFMISLFLLTACDSGLWNDPYTSSDIGKSVYYNVFTERPKHLDPAQSYSENEYVFLSQIYQPPLQYHYLKRPFTLIPQAAGAMPTLTYLDKNNQPLADNAPAEKVAYSRYEIRLRPGLKYQPHPAFARDAQGKLVYHNLGAAEIARHYSLNDFKQTGSREVSAADYAYQIKRLVHPALHTPIGGLMGDYIVGLKEYAAMLQKAQLASKGRFLNLNDYSLEGVEVVDAHTYRIKVYGKYPQFAYWLAMPFFAPMPLEAEQFYAQPGMKQNNLTLDWWPVGSGPYYLSENNPNQRMVLTRNPNFSGEFYPLEGEPGDREAGLLQDAGKPLPLIDKVVFTLEKETIPYWSKFLQGYYDAAGISSDSFDQAVSVGVGGETNVTEAMRAQGIRLSTSVATSTMYMGFNFMDTTVGGEGERARKLRRAIALTVDYEEYISIFANGRGVSAQSPIPPGIFGYREGEAGINPYVYNWVNGAPQRKSLHEAKQILAEAGYANGIDEKTGQPLVIYLDTTATGVGGKSQLDWLRKQFDKINVQLVPRATDWNRFQDKLRRGDTQMFYLGWNADYPDPENFLFLLNGAQSVVGKDGANSSNYNNPEYDRLFEQMKNMTNGPARQLILDRMLEILRRDSPWLWGFHPKDYVLHHAWLYNSKPNKMALNRLKYLRIDSAQRETARKQWNQPLLWPLWLGGLVLVFSAWWLWRVLRKREEAR